MEADANQRKSAQAIVKQVTKKYLKNQNPCAALKPIQNLINNTNYHRRKNRPHHPKKRNFNLSQQKIPEGFLVKDIWVDKHRSIILATPTQLQMLKKSKTWYIDATFSLVRKPFKQITINCFIKSENSIKQVPLLTVIMSGKRTVDYEAILNAVMECIPEAAVKRVVLDYEAAMWWALQNVMPDVELRGCAFHYSQAIWRYAQTKCGLKTAYNEDDGTYNLIRKLIGLSLMPAELIPSMFNFLRQQATNSKLQRLVNYVEDTWILAIGKPWSPETWSVYGLPISTWSVINGPKSTGSEIVTPLYCSRK